MMEFISDWIDNIETDKTGWAFIFWAVCLLVLWKLMYDPKFISLWVKIVLSIVMLPISYLLLVVIGNR